MPHKQIVFRAMEPTRGQAALLAALLPTLHLPNFWSFPLTSSWQGLAGTHSLSTRRDNNGEDKAMGSLQSGTIERAWTRSQEARVLVLALLWIIFVVLMG